MKKVLLILLIAIFVVSSVVGVTAVVSNNLNHTTVAMDTDETIASSELYEVIEFIPPEKTVYSLSDVETIDISIDENEERFVQDIDFDGTGMSMTVKHKETGKITKYDYTCEYFDLEDMKLKCEGVLSFYFNPGVNVVLTEGKHTTEIILITDEDECVMHEMEFTLVDDTKPEKQTPTEVVTQATTEADTEIKNKVPADNSSENTCTDNQDSENYAVIPTLRTVWYNENNPSGCKIVINSQEGNTLDFTVSSQRNDSAQIATSDITVTLDSEYDGSIVRGHADFEYVDSFGNSGTGSVSVSENVIILVINEEYNDGRGWGISHTTGKYLY